MKAQLITLLRELPADTIVATYLDGHPPRTAGDMIEELSSGSEVGLQWGGDLLRVARDYLVRQASVPGQRE